MPAIRKSYTEISKIYFFTATIYKFKILLHNDNKRLIVDYLRKLSEDGLLRIYAFVIMPNHVHLIWKQLSPWFVAHETKNLSLAIFFAHSPQKLYKTIETFSSGSPQITKEFNVVNNSIFSDKICL